MWHQLTVLTLLLVTSIPFGSVGVCDEPLADPNPKREELDDLLQLFVETFNEVDRNYATPLSRRELMEAAINGMTSKLDEHSKYIRSDELDAFRRGVDSEFGGIGVHVMMENGELTIISPILDSPAYRAKLSAGDTITKIDGTATKGLSLADAVEKLKGKLGSAVELTVRPAGANEAKVVTIVRDIVRIRTVLGDHRRDDDSWQYLYDPDFGIGYVRITSFARNTGNELQAVMREQAMRGMNGLILDLRSNPGGLLSSAIDVCDMFIEKGMIVSMSSRHIASRRWYAHAAGTHTGFPMAVLVNRFSASASEIVAACLQDHERAVIIGQRTWGKGCVQNIFDLENGNSALKLTTAEYHRPNGKNIDRKPEASDDEEWGVRPDDGLELRLTDSDTALLYQQRQSKDLLRARSTVNDEIKDRQFELAVKYMTAEITKRRGESELAKRDR